MSTRPVGTAYAHPAECATGVEHDSDMIIEATREDAKIEVKAGNATIVGLDKDGLRVAGLQAQFDVTPFPLLPQPGPGPVDAPNSVWNFIPTPKDPQMLLYSSNRPDLGPGVNLGLRFNVSTSGASNPGGAPPVSDSHRLYFTQLFLDADSGSIFVDNVTQEPAEVLPWAVYTSNTVWGDYITFHKDGLYHIDVNYGKSKKEGETPFVPKTGFGVYHINHNAGFSPNVNSADYNWPMAENFGTNEKNLYGFPDNRFFHPVPDPAVTAKRVGHYMGYGSLAPFGQPQTVAPRTGDFSTHSTFTAQAGDKLIFMGSQYTPNVVNRVPFTEHVASFIRLTCINVDAFSVLPPPQ